MRSPPTEPVAGVVASGSGSVAVGGSIYGSAIATGPGARAFVGAYVELEVAALDPASVYARVALDRFIGREWLEREVDAFLAEQDRGLLILEAAAGLGKTAFLAHLARSRSWCHHFVEMAPGASGVETGLQNLSAQLIRRWKLAPYFADGVMPVSASRPEFLASLLTRAAQARDAAEPSERIVIVVDALDESVAPEGHNVMGLPRLLPQGVYLIVSQRPVAVSLAATGITPKILRLEAGETQNLDDMRRFLNAAAARPAITLALTRSGRTTTEFVGTLLERGRGVWIYLQYVITEIEQGNYDPLVLEELPFGVWQYYAEFWNRWRVQASWPSEFLPLLASLAAAQEDVTTEQLCAFANASNAKAVGVLLEGAWRPFITVVSGTPPQYRCYHASLREFLDGRVDPAELTTAQQSTAAELATATREAHGRIADQHLAAWGGLEGNLPGLRALATATPGSNYGLKHVVAHLAAAGRASDLERLLTSEWHEDITRPVQRSGWRGGLDRIRRHQHFATVQRFHNAWFTTKSTRGDVAGYLADINRTWRAAESVSRSTLNAGNAAPSVVLEVRCALMSASVRTLAGNLGPKLLASLVNKKVMSPLLAYAFADQTPDQVQRMLALLHVAPALGEPARTEAFRGALGALLAIPNRELASTFPHFPAQLPEWVWQETFRTVCQRLPDDEYALAHCLALLAPLLPEAQMAEYYATAQKVKRAGLRASAAALLRSSPGQREQIEAEIRKQTRLSAEELATILPVARALSPAARGDLLAQAREHLMGAYDVEQFAGPLLDESDEARRLEIEDHILGIARKWDPRDVIRLIGPLLPRFSSTKAIRLLEEISIQTNDPLLEREFRVYRLRVVAKQGGFNDALQMADTLGPNDAIYYPDKYAEALITLTHSFLGAKRASPALRQDIFSRIAAMSSASPRQRALEAIAPELESAELERALTVSREIGDRYKAEHILIELAERAVQLEPQADLLWAARDVRWYPGRAVATVASSLPRASLPEAIKFARQNTSSADQAEAFVALAAAGAPRARAVMKRAIRSILVLPQPRERVAVISRMLGRPSFISALPATDREQLISTLLADLRVFARQLDTVYDTERAIPRILFHLDETRQREVLGIASTIQNPWTLQSLVRRCAAVESSPPLRYLLQRDQFPAPVAAPGTPAIRDSQVAGAPALTGLAAEKEVGSILDNPDAAVRVRRLCAFVETAREVQGWKRSAIITAALGAALSLPAQATRNEALLVLRPHLDLFGQLAIDQAINREARSPATADPLVEFRNVLLQAGARIHAAGSDGTRLADHVATISIRSIVDLLVTLDHELHPPALAEFISRLPSDEGEQAFLEYLSLQPQRGYRLLPAVKNPPSTAIIDALLAGLAGPNVSTHEWEETVHALLEWVPEKTLVAALDRTRGRLPDDRRGEWYRTLARRLESASLIAVHEQWSRELVSAARRQREEFLDVVAALAPLAHRLGGKNTLPEIFGAVRQCIHWWP